MTSVSNQQAGVARTERGLVIAETRITLYQLMDYLQASRSFRDIQQHFPQITEEQLEAAMLYIKANRAEVEAEYQVVVKEDEELRQYYEEQNRERLAQIAKLPPLPGQEAVWAKLQVAKARLESQT